MAELAVGTTIAGYRIDSIAGYGGMGVVYAATELELGRRVALKVIHADRAADESFRERFMRESRIAASIDHPNVIPIYRAAAEADRLYIAMRYVDGTDLRSLVALSGRLPASRAAAIVVQVAAALDSAHARGLVHRDVKPANVLIDRDDHAYLTDFGVAKTTDAPTMTRTGQFVGTVQYAAPEQFRGERLDARTDVYSLGAVLFYAVSCEPPFVRDSDAAAMYAQLSEHPRDVRELEPSVPAELAAVIALALEKDPEARFQTAGDFGRAALAAAASGGDEATVVPPARGSQIHDRATVVGERARRTPKHPALLAAAVLLLLAAVVAAVLVLVSGNRRHQVATIPMPGEPGALRAGSDGLWVGDDHAGAIRQIGAAGGRFTGSAIGVGGKPADIALADGGVWVAIKALRAVVRVDPAGRRVDATIAVPFRPNRMTVGDGRIFVTGRSRQIEQIDPARARVDGRPIASDAGRKQILFADGAILIANADRDQLSRTDLSSGRTARVPVSGSPDGLDAGDGSLWVVSASGTLTKLDPRSLTTIGTVAVGGRPDAVAAAGSSVFVASAWANQVTQVDGRSMRVVRRYAVGDSPAAIAQFAHAIWVSNFNGASLSRIALP